MGLRGSSLISQPARTGISDLRDHRVFIAVHAGEECLALFNGSQQIAANFILDGARSAARVEIGNALELAQGARFRMSRRLCRCAYSHWSLFREPARSARTAANLVRVRYPRRAGA